MNEGEGKNIVIRVDEHQPSSRHTLDLKRGSKKSETLKNGAMVFSTPKNKLLNELFFFSLIGGFFGIIIFFPRFIAKKTKQLFGGLAGIIPRVKTSLRVKTRRCDAWPVSFDFVPPLHCAKGLGVFAFIALIIILPVKAFSSYEDLMAQKNEVMEWSLDGYESLKKSDFSAASASFASAKKTIDGLGVFFNGLASFIPGVGDKLSFGNGLLVFGKNFSDAAAILQSALNYFDTDAAFTEKIKFLKLKIDAAVPYLLVADRIVGVLEKDFPILPFNIAPIKEALDSSTKALLVFQNFSDTLLDVLGDKHFKRYLFIFQNNNEIRPTGGFMGSFGIIDVDRGEIKKMEIPGGGTYDVKGQLKELVISPEPFHLINSAWQFQDSNWFPDFPEAAKKMMWFYEKSGGPSVDGVVAIDASLMAELLNIIGPIEMPEYGRIMTAENFIDETQKIVELEYDKTINKPKQVIADMAPKVLERLSKISAKDLAVFSEVIHEAILDKDVLVYVKNDEMEKELDSFGLSGKLKDISELTDYLMLVDTNIAGQKTDGKIIKEIKHESEIAEDGSVVNVVTIARRHTGVKGALFSGVRNVNYLRLYVPQGAELIEATGFTAPPGELFKTINEGYSPDKDLERVQGPVYVEPRSGTRVNNEFGRTVFGNWIMVDPGREAVVTFKYKLPNKFIVQKDGGYWENALGLADNFSAYTMLIEKQPGAKNTTFKSYVKLSGGKTAARVGESVALQNDGWQYETALNGDKYWGAVVEN